MAAVGPKRGSGAIGGGLSPGGEATPAASTQAQFRSDSAMGMRGPISAVNGGMQSNMQATQARGPMGNGNSQEHKPSGMQKFMKALCCGR